MQYSVLDLKMNGIMWRYECYPPHLINVATLPCESWNTENACEQRCGNKKDHDLFLYVTVKNRRAVKFSMIGTRTGVNSPTSPK